MDRSEEQHQVQKKGYSNSVVQAALTGDKENPEDGNAASPSVTSCKQRSTQVDNIGGGHGEVFLNILGKESIHDAVKTKK